MKYWEMDEDSLGWARANLVYQKLDKIPKYGSLLESMCLILWKELLDIDVAQARAQAQAALGGDEAKEAFKDYSSMALRKKTKEKQDQDIMKQRLENVARMGKIQFQPVDLPTAKTANIPRVRRKK